VSEILKSLKRIQARVPARSSARLVRTGGGGEDRLLVLPARARECVHEGAVLKQNARIKGNVCVHTKHGVASKAFIGWSRCVRLRLYHAIHWTNAPGSQQSKLRRLKKEMGWGKETRAPHSSAGCGAHRREEEGREETLDETVRRA